MGFGHLFLAASPALTPPAAASAQTSGARKSLFTPRWSKGGVKLWRRNWSKKMGQILGRCLSQDKAKKQSTGNTPAGIPGMGAKSLKHQCLPQENRAECHSEATRKITPVLSQVLYQFVPVPPKHHLPASPPKQCPRALLSVPAGTGTQQCPKGSRTSPFHSLKHSEPLTPHTFPSKCHPSSQIKCDFCSAPIYSSL